MRSARQVLSNQSHLRTRRDDVSIRIPAGGPRPLSDSFIAQRPRNWSPASSPGHSGWSTKQRAMSWTGVRDWLDGQDRERMMDVVPCSSPEPLRLNTASVSGASAGNVMSIDSPMSEATDTTTGQTPGEQRGEGRQGQGQSQADSEGQGGQASNTFGAGGQASEAGTGSQQLPPRRRQRKRHQPLTGWFNLWLE